MQDVGTSGEGLVFATRSVERSEAHLIKLKLMWAVDPASVGTVSNAYRGNIGGTVPALLPLSPNRRGRAVDVCFNIRRQGNGNLAALLICVLGGCHDIFRNASWSFAFVVANNFGKL